MRLPLLNVNASMAWMHNPAGLSPGTGAACMIWPSLHLFRLSCKSTHNWPIDGYRNLQATLGLLPEANGCLSTLPGCVINVNFPAVPSQECAGIYLTHQGLQCMFPVFKEITEQPGPHLAEIEEHTPNQRIFR
jgi:hypothetical protein